MNHDRRFTWPWNVCARQIDGDTTFNQLFKPDLTIFSFGQRAPGEQSQVTGASDQTEKTQKEKDHEIGRCRLVNTKMSSEVPSVTRTERSRNHLSAEKWWITEEGIEP